jgi:hypothetical protein
MKSEISLSVVCLSVRPPVSLSVRPPVRVSVFLSVSQSVSLSVVCQSVFLLLCLSVYALLSHALIEGTIFQNSSIARKLRLLYSRDAHYCNLSSTLILIGIESQDELIFLISKVTYSSSKSLYYQIKKLTESRMFFITLHFLIADKTLCSNRIIWQ